MNTSMRLSCLQTRQERGFTLIETLVYLALYTIIIGGALAAAYGMFESSAHNETIAMVEEEGEYLLAKIHGVLSNAVSIQSPATSGNTLSVTHADGSTASIWNTRTSMGLQENTALQQTLNNSNVSVTNLSFVHTLSTSDGLNPESISASFMLRATTSDGHVLSHDFSLVQYLHK
jgi:Tfp pilus assembly protein FimT